MAKKLCVLSGIILWAVSFGSMIWQAGTGGIPVELDFFLHLLLTVFAAAAETALLTLVFAKQDRGGWKGNLGYALFLGVNFLFILWEVWVVVLMFLFF